MIEPDGTVRVLDLGLARITRAADPLQTRESDPSLTHSGMIMGTVDFLPPEQSNNSKLADYRSDVYALGCTLYYLLIGRPPFDGETIMERLIAHHQKPVPSLLDQRPEVTPGLDAAFRRMLEKDPARRPQSMVEVIALLERVFTDNPPTAPASIPLVDRRPPLEAGRVPIDRVPDPSDLSGYEILTESQSKIWSPILEAPAPEPMPLWVEPEPIVIEPKPKPKPKAPRPAVATEADPKTPTAWSGLGGDRGRRPGWPDRDRRRDLPRADHPILVGILTKNLALDQHIRDGDD